MFNCFRWIFLSLKGNLYYGCSHGFVIAVLVDTSGVLCLHGQRGVSGTIPSYGSVQHCCQPVLQSPALLIYNGMNTEQNPILIVYFLKNLKTNISIAQLTLSGLPAVVNWNFRYLCFLPFPFLLEIRVSQWEKSGHK